MPLRPVLELVTVEHGARDDVLGAEGSPSAALCCIGRATAGNALVDEILEMISELGDRSFHEFGLNAAATQLAFESVELRRLRHSAAPRVPTGHPR
jgi:hypothetical protein